MTAATIVVKSRLRERERRVLKLVKYRPFATHILHRQLYSFVNDLFRRDSRESSCRHHPFW